jgi:CDP-paratose 2-epimerase
MTRILTRRVPEGTTLITGGAGFVGSNLAHRIASAGGRVILFDNLARAQVQYNAQKLLEQHGRRIELVIGDVRNTAALREVVARADRVVHLAAQVAVTTSLVDPIEDFEINARGTLNVLEAIRSQGREIPLLFTSTNKVYGALPDIPLELRDFRWEPRDVALRITGLSEDRSLDFHSPYGCSKGAADQLVLDWSRSYGIPTVVFRMSCIYGPRQFGTEDQGWVAHFVIRALRREPIVLYGDGMQTRDVLFVEDLLDSMELAFERIDDVRGRAFNVGGGPSNAVSLLELLALLSEITGNTPETTYAPARVGDQRWYVSDARRIREALGWSPRTRVRDGVERLVAWLYEPLKKASVDRAAFAGALP